MRHKRQFVTNSVRDVVESWVRAGALGHGIGQKRSINQLHFVVVVEFNVQHHGRWVGTDDFNFDYIPPRVQNDLGGVALKGTKIMSVYAQWTMYNGDFHTWLQRVGLHLWVLESSINYNATRSCTNGLTSNNDITRCVSNRRKISQHQSSRRASISCEVVANGVVGNIEVGGVERDVGDGSCGGRSHAITVGVIGWCGIDHVSSKAA